MLFYILTILAQSQNNPLIAAENAAKEGKIPLSGILMVGLVMVVVFVIMRSTARKTALSRQRHGRKPQDIVKQQLKENPYHTIDRLQELMAELADMSREINGQIDTRTAKLEILLAQADVKIEKYQKVMNQIQLEKLKAQNQSSEDKTESDSINLNERKEVDTTSDIKTEPETLIPNTNTDPEPQVVDYQVSDTDISINHEENNSSGEPEIEHNEKVEKDDNAQILELAQKGMELADISRITGRPSGEVELILNLSGFKNGK